MEELKPCPFCGGEADCNKTGIYEYYGIPLWWVECLSCGINTGGYNTRGEAIETWNRRATDERIN